jgi:hypothetical protein
LLEYVKKLDKGKRHQLLRSIFKDINYNFNRTYERNTLSDFKDLLNLCDNLNIEIKEARNLVATRYDRRQKFIHCNNKNTVFHAQMDRDEENVCCNKAKVENFLKQWKIQFYKKIDLHCYKLRRQKHNLLFTAQMDSLPGVKKAKKWVKDNAADIVRSSIPESVEANLNILTDATINVLNTEVKTTLRGLDKTSTAIREAVVPALDKIQQTTNAIKLATEDFGFKIQTVFTKVQGMLSAASSLDTLIGNIMNVFAFICAIREKCSIQLISATAFNMMRGIVPLVDLKGFTENLKNYLDLASKNIFKAQSDSDDCFVKAISRNIWLTFKHAFCAMDKKTFENFNVNTKKVESVTRFLKAMFGCQNLTTMGFNLLDIIFTNFEKYYNKFLGIPNYTNLVDFGEIEKKVRDMEKQGYDKRCQLEQVSANKVVELRQELHKFMMENKRNFLQTELEELRDIKKVVQLWYDSIPVYLMSNTAIQRPQPVHINFYGAPGIGKTSVMVPLLASKLSKELNLASNYEKPSTLCFEWPLGREFKQGYNNQPIVTITDMFQAYKNTAKMDESIEELTRMCDGNAYPVNVADLGPNGKGKNFFGSSVIITDCQQDFFDIPTLNDRCLSTGTHLERRVDLKVEMELNPKYSAIVNGKPLGVDIKKYIPEQSKGNYYGTICPKDAYTFKCVTGKGIKLYFTDIEVFIDYVGKYALEIRDERRNFTSGVEDKCKSFFNERLEECKQNTTFSAQMAKSESGESFATCIEHLCNVEGCVTEELFRKHNYKGSHICFSDYMECFEYYEELLIDNVNKCKDTETLGVLSTKLQFVKRLYLRSYEKFKDGTSIVLKKIREKCPRYEWFMTLFGVLGISFGLYALYNNYNNKASENNYIKPSDRIKAQSHESSERKILPKRQRGKNTNMNAQMDNCDSDQLKTLLSNSSFKLVIYINVNGVETIMTSNSVLNWCGELYLTNKHFWDAYLKKKEQYGNNIRLAIVFPNTTLKKVYLDDTTIIAKELSWRHLTDATFLYIPKVCIGKDLTSKFVKLNSDFSYNHCALFGPRSIHHHCKSDCDVFKSTPMYKMETLKVKNTELIDRNELGEEDVTLTATVKDPLSNVDQVTVYNVPEYYLYEAETKAGDCGMVLMNLDVKSNAKIMGIHFGGTDNGCNDLGIAIPIFYEDLMEIMEYFKVVGKTITYKKVDETFVKSVLPTIGFAAQASQLDLNIEGTTNDYTTANGKISNYCTFMNTENRIQKSVAYELLEDELGPATTKPTHLGRFKNNDGNYVSPMLLGLGKLTSCTGLINNEDFKLIRRHLSDTIISWHSPWNSSNTKVLNILEALNGTNGLKPIDITTSAGFPFIKLAPDTSKSPWLIITEKENKEKYFEPCDILTNMVNHRLEMASKGIIIPTFFVDTLKAERRLIEKVDQGKTRLFQVGPLDLTLCLRMLFGDFIAHCQKTFLNGEMAIGINPESIEWTVLWKRLSSKGNNYLCGDYSNYDASLSNQLGTLVYKVANDFYSDSGENKQIRKTLVLTLFNSDHLVDRLWFSFRQGNPSGDALTSIVNCIVNMALVRYSYMRRVDSTLSSFHDNMVCSFYGDDCVIGVSEMVKGKFTMKTYESDMNLLGIVYTSATKGEIKLDYVDSNDVTFLKRGFTRDGSIYRATMDKDVILEIPRWCEGSLTNAKDQLGRFNTSLLYMSNYGKKQFEKLRNVYVNVIKKLNSGEYIISVNNKEEEISLNIKLTDLFTYERTQIIMYPNLFDHNPKCKMSFC